MPLEIRSPTDDEVPAWIEAMRVGFLDHAAEGEAEVRRPGIDLARTVGVFDGDRVVGTLRSFPTDIVVPGGALLSCSALTNVTVAPTHRRRGLLTSMMSRDLTESVERGEAVSALIAAEYPIYGRFGYGPAVDVATLVVDATAEFRGPRVAGSIELVDKQALRKEAPAVYEEARRRSPGAIGRTERRWDLDLGIVETPGPPPAGPTFLALGRDADGRPDGFVIYRSESKWVEGRPLGTLHVEEMVAIDEGAAERLWRFVLEIDWISTVQFENAGLGDLLPWLLVDARYVSQRDRTDIEWVRVLDVEQALSARRYLCDGEITIEVVDELGIASGRFRLVGGPEGADCRRTEGTADLVVPVEVLGAAFLGGPSLADLARARAVVESTPGALARADAMFRGATAPACMTFF